MYDVQWSPVHPAVFASGDGTGQVDLWNLNKNAEEATASFKLAGKDAQANIAVSRLRWSAEGDMIACGTSRGAVQVLAVAAEEARPFADSEDVLYANLASRTLDPNSLSP